MGWEKKKEPDKKREPDPSRDQALVRSSMPVMARTLLVHPLAAHFATRGTRCSISGGTPTATGLGCEKRVILPQQGHRPAPKVWNLSLIHI